MTVDSQQARRLIGWTLGIVCLSPLALYYLSSNPRVTLSDVTGRVTYSGHPLTGVNIALVALDPRSGNHTAVGILGSDGSFRLQSMDDGRLGTVPGPLSRLSLRS